MLSALMINGLNPGLSLFTTQGDIMYAIMLGLLFVNLFMLLQGKYLTKLFAKVVSIPQEILTPIIVSELHLCRIKNGGDGEKSLTCENEFRIVCFRFSNPAIYRCRVTLYCVSDENDLIRISI